MTIPLVGSPAFAHSRRTASGNPVKSWHRPIDRAYRDDAGESHDHSRESQAAPGTSADYRIALKSLFIVAQQATRAAFAQMRRAGGGKPKNPANPANSAQVRGAHARDRVRMHNALRGRPRM